MPKVSVIIPTYNREEYVHHAIDSVLLQTFVDYEIIVVDDGSTDNTREVLGEYINSEKIIYIYQDNAGVSVARNIGINNAKSKWITFLDSDDVWYPRKLEFQMKVAEENNASVIFTDYVCEDGRNFIFEDLTDNFEVSEWTKPLELYFSRCLLLQSLMIDKSIISRFDTSLKVAEDTKFIWDIALKNSFWYISKPLVCLNQNSSDNLSKNNHNIYADIHCELLVKLYLNIKCYDAKFMKKLSSVISYHLYKKATILLSNSITDSKRIARLGIFYSNIFSFKINVKLYGLYFFPRLFAFMFKKNRGPF